MRIELGWTAKDKITGFQGVVTGRAEYLTGCNQLLVVPPLGADGSPREPHWYDEQRLDRIGDDKVTLDNGKTPGFDKAAPIR